MPHLNLKVAPLQNPERYQALAGALTELTARILRKRPEVTAVTIEDYPAARWFVGTVDVQRPTAMLEISITQGTNIFGEPGCVMMRRSVLESTGWWDSRWPYLIDQASYSRVLLEGSFVGVTGSLAGFRGKRRV